MHTASLTYCVSFPCPSVFARRQQDAEILSRQLDTGGVASPVPRQFTLTLRLGL